MARRCGAQLHAVMGGSQRDAAVRYCMPSREPADAVAVRHCTRTRFGLGNGEPWRGGVALCGCGAVTWGGWMCACGGGVGCWDGLCGRLIAWLACFFLSISDYSAAWLSGKCIGIF
jgi:hypothetical protein